MKKVAKSPFIESIRTEMHLREASTLFQGAVVGSLKSITLIQHVVGKPCVSKITNPHLVAFIT
jgi:hypothetical protein